MRNDSPLRDGDLVLIDAGCEYKYYASDISRTWPVNGKFTEPQREIYQLVLDVQKACIEMVKPGLNFIEIHDKSVEMITEGLIRLGLLSGTVEQNIFDGSYDRFYMHGVGHWLGMDVHDCPSTSMRTKLKPGHVFTIEPGIYIPCDTDIPEKYRGIGVRIEDDILVTENGYEVLSCGAPKEIQDIELVVGRA